jgi:hypothetical protein
MDGNQMGHEVAVNSYQDLMFGHFNTPAALDDLIYLLDWDEMYDLAPGKRTP